MGKMSEEKYAASLGTKAKQIALNNFDYFYKDVKSTAIQFYIYRVCDKHSRLDCNKNNNTKCKTLYRRVAEIQIFEKTYLIVIKDETGLKFKMNDSTLFLIGSYAQKLVASY